MAIDSTSALPIQIVNSLIMSDALETDAAAAEKGGSPSTDRLPAVKWDAM